MLKTAYKPEQYIRVTDDAYMRLEAVFSHAKNQGQTSRQLDEEVNAVIGSTPEYPRALRTQLRGFADALRRRVDREQTCFLYNIEGQFYSVTSSKDTGFPRWDTLPREMWDKLGPHGGIYWRGSHKPYYQSERG